ncbi:MAG: translation initiation factor IF-3 [Patescibacteria group bacterium]
MREQHYVNNKIRFSQVRVITDSGENLGVISTKDALREAQNREKDLVVISAKANPPVAKILDYAKFLYETNKKASATKAKAKQSQQKELRFGPSVGEGDLKSYIKRAKEFIGEGNRVKITVKMKGRENQYPQIATDKIKYMANELVELAKLDGEPKRNGSQIIGFFIKK